MAGERPSGGTPGLSPVSKAQVLDNDDLLGRILARVSKARGGTLRHALVCRRWLQLAPLSQTHVRVHEGARLSEVTLLAQLRAYPALVSLTLPRHSLRRLTDFFLGALGFHFPGLRHLDIGRHAALLDTVSGVYGLSSFFLCCPGLRTFRHTTLLQGGEGGVGLSPGAPVQPLPLPSSVTTLGSLRSLSFSRCCAVPPFLGALSSLRRLFLDSATLGSLPDSTTALTRLTYLHLSMPALTSLPAGLGNLACLTVLHIQGSQLPGLPDSLGHLSRLQRLVLTSCPVLASLPRDLAGLSSLKHLKVAFCPQLKDIPASMGGLELLERINLRACGLRGLPHAWGSLPRLTVLILTDLWSLESLPPDLAHSQSLRVLLIDGCPMLEMLPPGLQEHSALHVGGRTKASAETG